MILRRYGTTIQSVEAKFDSKAFTEVGFRRDHAFSCPTDDFLDRHDRISEHLLDAESEGEVQDEVEAAMLAKGQSEVPAGVDGTVELGGNRHGADHGTPKTCQPFEPEQRTAYGARDRNVGRGQHSR